MYNVFSHLRAISHASRPSPLAPQLALGPPSRFAAPDASAGGGPACRPDGPARTGRTRLKSEGVVFQHLFQGVNPRKKPEALRTPTVLQPRSISKFFEKEPQSLKPAGQPKGLDASSWCAGHTVGHGTAERGADACDMERPCSWERTCRKGE